MNKHRTQRTWWNRLLSGVLCLALALGLLPTAGLVQTADAAYWADPYGQQLVEWGVMNAGSDLRLSDTITRAEFVAMCNRAFGYKRLGSMPFTDVPSSAWYAEDINIASNAGYFNGGSYNKAYPNDPLTREQAAVLLARNMRLQETVGESQGFTDSRDLSEWSRGLIGAAVAEGVITGYTDGSFLPFNNITRGEVAALLVRAIGTPVNRAGNYELGNVYGNVFINTSNVTLRNTVILGNLYITGGVDLGNALLENVTVLGRIVISGGGVSDSAKSSVILRNVTADEMVVDSLINQFVTVSAYGITDIPSTYVRSNSYLEDSCASGYGLHYIEQDGATLLQLAGSIKEVKNTTPFSKLQLVKGTAEKITIDEHATNSQLLIDMNTVANEVNLDVATLVTGEGDIIDLNIAADGCEVDILPEHVEIRPGITATIDDEEIGSVAASELSSEPRLLAGYPKVTGLKPNEAVLQFAGNKPGTIYWAVSAIADGSVSPEDLLNPPSYGGNIHQSGNFSYASGTIHAWPVSDLEADGSYYISAILVDARGNRSPLKVVSFTTPDDTVPDFAEEPRMTKTTCEVAQVATMANKSCTLYWVLLPHGAAAPTASNFKSNSFGGNYGYGSISVVKNVPVTLQVNNTSRLQEKTDYDLYLWLNDFDGARNSPVKHVVNEKTGKDSDPTFSTPDETPPVVTRLEQTDYSKEDSIGFTFSINEAPATLYWSVVLETDNTFIKTSDDLNGLRAQMRVQGGTGALVNGHKEVASTAEVLVNATEFLKDASDTLAYSKHHTHNFKMYYVAVDANNNYSEVKSITIHTLDNEEPEVTIDFSSAMYNTDEDKAAGLKPRPQTDSDIMLIFTEQVKGEGGDSAKTFVELYDAVAGYESQGLKDSDSLLKNAKDALGNELAKHITLLYVHGRETTELAAPTRNAQGQLSGTQKTYGWLDLREATVKLMDDGRVMLTLPAGKAVQLGGGMEYYFHFENIFDDSYTSNPLKVKRSDGTWEGGTNANGIKNTVCNMDSFTTVYAQVWLDPPEVSVSKIEDTGALNNTRLDIVMNVTPKTISDSVIDNYWDMVIWCDIGAKFHIYRRTSTDGGENWGNWEKVNTGTDPVRAYANVPLSLSYNVKNGVYSTIKDGLKKDVIYQYGFCFVEVNNVEISLPSGITDKTKGEPQTWSNLVTMKFGLVAGSRTDIENFSRSVGVQYDEYVPDIVSEIGSAGKGSDTQTTLSLSKQFTDKRAPEFRSDSPSFTATSSTITMKAYLNRTGILYYLAIPAENLAPSYNDNSSPVYVNSANDGSTLNGGEIPSGGVYDSTQVGTLVAGKKTYIPANGKDREANKASIYFVPSTTGAKGGVYTSPVSDDIYDSSKYTSSNKYAVAGSYRYTAVQETEIPLTGNNDQHNLKPNTWYYVYLVLRSDSGTFDDVVQVYRVKTADVTPPAITVNRTAVPQSESGVKGGNSTTGVSMSVRDAISNAPYDNPMLYYALARKDDLPSYFKDWYTWDSEKGTATKLDKDPGNTATATQMTVLSAMINKPTGSNRTYFDLCADNNLKNLVMRYITDATSDTTYGSTVHGYDPINVNSKLQECVGEMSMDGEYVILACARHNSDDIISDITKYGFAATQGLFRPDNVPPEFTGTVDQLVRATITSASKEYNGTPDPKWGNWSNQEIFNGWYSGQITLTFSKAIYVYDTKDGNTLKKVVGNAAANSKTEISITDVISAPANVFWYATSTSDTSFTLHFANLTDGQSLIMQNLYNSTGSAEGKSPKRLTVTFDAKTNTQTFGQKDEEGNDVFITYAVPSFLATWKVP